MSTPLMNAPSFAAATTLAAESKTTRVLLVEDNESDALLVHASLAGLAGELARDVHSLALELRPTALDDLGLEVALSNHIDAWSSRWKISADFHSRGFLGGRLALHLETTIYRIAQEALTNIARHARAGRVSVVIERTDDRLILIVEDDGCGFDVKAVMKNAETEQRLGLLGMKERVALVSGSLWVESAQGGGTTLYVRIPFPL